MGNKNKVITYGGIALIIGCLSVVIADVIGILVVEDHNPIRQTISQLAHGKYAYIQDIGLTIFGLGIIAGATALFVWKPNSSCMKWCSILLTIMGICIIVLSEFNQFAGQPGTKIHIALAISIGILFLANTLLFGIAINDISKKWNRASISIGAIFFLSLFGFLFISESYEGAYERGVGFIILLWFCVLGYQLATNHKEISN